MSTLADEVLQARKVYKRAKKRYDAAMAAAQAAGEQTPEQQVEAAKKRKRAKKAERSEKEKANDDRLRALTARAKEIRAAEPGMKWTDAVKKAAAEAKANAPEPADDSSSED